MSELLVSRRRLLGAGALSAGALAIPAWARGADLEALAVVRLPDDRAIAHAADRLVRSGGFGLDVSISVSLPGLDADVAQDLIDTAHAVCPYSNAINGNVDVTTTVA